MTIPSALRPVFRLCQRERWPLVLLAAFLALGLWLSALLPAPGQAAPAPGSVLRRLPFLLTACALALSLWRLNRRHFGSLGGLTALAFFLLSPSVWRAALQPNADLLAALGLYGSVYTCIGVAHALQGPRRKWPPRLALLTVFLALTAGAQITAAAYALTLGTLCMLWIAEGRRAWLPPLLGAACVAALALLYAGAGFSTSVFAAYFSWPAGGFALSLGPAARFFASPANLGFALATAAALALYAMQPRSRYFGHTAPLLCFLALAPLTSRSHSAEPWLWAQPFLFSFLAGLFTDAYTSRRGRVARLAALLLLLLQAALCWTSLAAGLPR